MHPAPVGFGAVGGVRQDEPPASGEQHLGDHLRDGRDREVLVQHVARQQDVELGAAPGARPVEELRAADAGPAAAFDTSARSPINAESSV